MAYIEHDFPIDGLNAIAQKEGNANGWLPERHLPDKALGLLEKACARARIPISLRPRRPEREPGRHRPHHRRGLS